MIDVTAAIMIKDDKVLIARRHADDKLAGKWEFPGGKIRGNETPEACLKREMAEEFGIVVSVGVFMGESVYRYPHDSIRLLAYRTDWVSGELQPRAHAAYRWVSCDQLETFDFSAADIPFVETLRQSARQCERNHR
jgi:8-oxo-dGTP diphosphatase